MPLIETLSVGGFVVFAGGRVRVIKRLPELARLRKRQETVGALLAYLGCPLLPGDPRGNKTWSRITRTIAGPNPILREIFPVSPGGVLGAPVADDAIGAERSYLSLTETDQ